MRRCMAPRVAERRVWKSDITASAFGARRCDHGVPRRAGIGDLSEGIVTGMAKRRTAKRPAKTTCPRKRITAATRSSLFISSIEKVFQVLHAFHGTQRQMSLAEIARAAQLDRSAAQRLVHTLEQLGYLRRILGTRNFALTSKVLRFSYNYMRANEIIDKASPYLLEIAAARRDDQPARARRPRDRVRGALSRPASRQHRLRGRPRLPAFFTASGTAILSRLPDDEREPS